MKAKFFTLLTVIALAGFAQASEVHHGGPKETATAKGKESMMGMMHECMKNHKDGKMCDEEMMKNCQQKMGKEECQKMMTRAKAQTPETKK